MSNKLLLLVLIFLLLLKRLFMPSCTVPAFKARSHKMKLMCLWPEWFLSLFLFYQTREDFCSVSLSGFLVFMALTKLPV